MIFPKPVTWKSKKYKEFIKEKDCLLGCPGPSDPHHVGLGLNKMGGLPPDSHMVPLCRGHHREVEDYAGGEAAFWEFHNIDIERKIISLITAFLIDRGIK